MERIVGSALNYPQKCFYHWTSTDFEIWVENSVFAIQHIKGIEKKFFWSASHKNCMIWGGGLKGCQMLKNSLL